MLKNMQIRKIVLGMLWLFTAMIFLYFILFPFYPGFKYQIVKSSAEEAWFFRDQAEDGDQAVPGQSGLPSAKFSSVNRLYIAKIGISAPIIESRNEAYGLNKGAWRMPDSSTPSNGGNTVITGHRFKYFPPNNVTFYNLDKLEIGDIITIIWNKEAHFYKAREIKIVAEEDLSILKQSDDPILTLLTCHPLFSTKQRLAVISEKINAANAGR